MMKVLFRLLAVLALAASPCAAQYTSNPRPIVGSFFVSVDDSATIYVNGKKAYTARINESRSYDLELKVGDRIVVHLFNELLSKRFLLLFVSADAKTIVSFRKQDFRIVPHRFFTDFKTNDFKKWEPVIQLKHEYLFPVKSHSEYVWGDAENCIIACTITPQMFSPVPK